jgi:hypothetical protein
MNCFDVSEYEIRYYKWIGNTNKFILDEENENFNIPSTDILTFHALYQQDHPNGKCHSSVFQWTNVR